MTTYPSRQELVDFLREPGRKKYIGVFQSEDDPEARCCLGHYAHMCGILGDPVQAAFDHIDAESEPGWAALPSDHWLFAAATPAEIDASTATGVSRSGWTLQTLLATANDGTDGFDTVIAVLEAE